MLDVLCGRPSNSEAWRGKLGHRIGSKKEQQLALQAPRHRQTTPEFKETYAIRSGIEGTLAQAADKLEMRRSRYRGLLKTHFQHVMTAAAIDVK